AGAAAGRQRRRGGELLQSARGHVMSLTSFDRGWWARATHQIWWSVGYLTTLFAGLVLGAFEVRRSSGPFLAASLAVLMVIVFAWLIRPRAALYATVFLTAVSDANTVWWFPFATNLSSWESISYVADSLAIRPVEISLVVGFTITGVREFARHRRPIVVTELTWPIVAFTAFVVLGFLRGVGASGGDMRIALFEGRALLYLLPVYCIAVAIC